MQSSMYEPVSPALWSNGVLVLYPPPHLTKSLPKVPPYLMSRRTLRLSFFVS